MKSLEEFLEHLVDLDIKLWIEEGRLRCRASKGKLTPEIKNELAERKEEIIQFLQQNQLDSSRINIPIKPVPRSKNLPLSFSQQRLWILEQLEDGNVAYNEGGAVHLEGSLDVKILQKSLEEIVRRHEVIRTNIQTINGEPYQVINETPNLYLEKIDISQLSPEKQQETWQEIAFNQFQLPFDLEKDLLLRVILVKLGDTSHNLLVIMHHIVCDGWSFGVLIKEFSRLYQAYQANLPSPLPELKVQYADYAVWQREWLSQERLQNQLDYWKKKLSGLSPLLELPLDYPRPPVQTFEGATEKFSLSQRLTQKLNQLTQQLDATLFMTLLSAFSVLLSRYSRQEDITLGSPIANRKRSEIEPLIGFFLNTLVMRVNLEDNPSVTELIKQVKKTCLEAYTHQDIPFEKLVEELQPERNMSHAPLFQVAFVLQNAPTEELKLPELTVSTIEVDRGIAKFDLSLFVIETEQGLKVNWEYNTDLFERKTITRMMGHFQVLLEAMVANPQEKVSKLPLLTEREEYKLLVEWNNTAVEYPQDKCIHQLFEEQVKKTPNAVAVVYEEEQLTYQELNQKANQLAHYLQKSGVKPDTLVGICVERSLEMVIGLLGILKAGGAYVPIDPNYPTDRIKYMLQDSAVSVLLTQEKLTKILPETKSRVITWEENGSEIDSESNINLEQEVTSENLAYIIYTSGSTGRPKGAMNAHNGVVNRLLWMQNTYKLNQDDRVLQKTPFSFDVSVWEFFWTLGTGASLVIAKPEGHKDSNYLRELIENKKVTTLHFVPSMLQVFLEEKEVSNCHSIKRVICSGEALPFDLKQKFSQKLNSELHNLYGPTEAAIDVSFWNCRQEIGKSIVPIGRPVSNTQLYILDQQLTPVPIGVSGELHIGGVQVGKGYLNRPELTAERFIPNPFGEGKLYKTGDLCCYLPDGNIEYIGRIDHQVKIRGFRIELGEIEAQLSNHPEIRESVVIAREDQPGNKRLVAYLVTQDVAEDSLNQTLRNYLKAQLPDYMIPSAFVLLEKLPLTPNGKLDRKALPTPDFSAVAQADFLPPSTHAEQILAQVWSEVLRLEQISINSNFFELGGDSILTIQIVARAKQAGLKITPKQLFEHQTIAQLATVTQESEELEVEQGILTGVAPLTPIQHWFFEQNLPEVHHWNQAVLLEVRSNINHEQLSQALKGLLQHHDTLRFKYEKIADRWQQSYQKLHTDFTVEVKDLANIKSSQQSNIIKTEANQAQKSLNLSKGELVRVVLFDLGDKQPSRLLIVIHHLAVDGVSWRILLEDLVTAYNQLTQGRDIALPSKTSSYRQWGNKLLEYAHSDALKAELDYWQSQSMVRADLPLDYEGDSIQNTEVSTGDITIALTPEETDTLLKEVPAAYNTQINEILLTALVLTFEQWTKHKSLRLDLEGHGREDLFEEIDLSRTVGWLTSIFPVNLSLGKQGTNNPGEAIKEIKEQLRQIPQKGIGYGILRYLSSDDKIKQSLKQIPQPQVSFNYLGQVDNIINSPPILKFATEPSGLLHSEEGQRKHLIDINSIIMEEQLKITWTYSKNLHHPETIEKLALNYLENLQFLIKHCLSDESGGFTPSDFPEIDLDQQELDDLLADL
ncbi:non-ribosomal peptide synthetase [Crocosphaera sp.]|uniref:non-ribosomal peptide synthetase n=1 Tax=Crocosphaera sp. TaxID=2729996 RepID=UPI0026331A3C|nr:non-ribosomal peptide synthetase [Crocosphaera sp.]MDJ0580938.1 amino acid adenylation domain-containing protein [Crocosphaera sp.]